MLAKTARTAIKLSFKHFLAFRRCNPRRNNSAVSRNTLNKILRPEKFLNYAQCLSKTSKGEKKL
jgi:hypothetical protein